MRRGLSNASSEVPPHTMKQHSKVTGCMHVGLFRALASNNVLDGTGQLYQIWQNRVAYFGVADHMTHGTHCTCAKFAESLFVA